MTINLVGGLANLELLAAILFVFLFAGLLLVFLKPNDAEAVARLLNRRAAALRAARVAYAEVWNEHGKRQIGNSAAARTSTAGVSEAS